MSINREDVNISDPETDTVIESLIEYLKTPLRMGEFIDQFYDEWPEANQGEFEKTMSIHTVDSSDVPHSPYVESTEEITNELVDVAATMVTGKIDIKIQVDMWLPYKKLRGKAYKQFIKSIDEEFLNNDSRPMGLSLPLINYFNTIARYDIVGYNFPDDQRSSQEDDWRIIIDMQVHFNKKVQKILPKMTDIQLVTDDGVVGNDTEEYISETVVI